MWKNYSEFQLNSCNMANENVNELINKPKLIKDLGLIIKPPNKHARRYGLYECPLCKISFICTHSQVNLGHTKSCGCMRYKNISKIITTHGMRHTRIYAEWCLMKNRCYNKKGIQYKDWGGRGIIVCNNWKNSFIEFYNWAMENGYSDNLGLDRINNDGNYEPSNCRWVNRYINAQNKRLIKSTNTSGLSGIWWNKRNNKWQAAITSNGERIYFGYYKDKKEAAIVRNNWIIENKTSHPLNIID